MLQAANGLMAGLTVVLVYYWVQTLKVPRDVAVPAALLFAFSATWWKFASDANAYVPSICLLLCAVLLLGRKPHASALLHAAAMLFHQLAILFLPAALLRLRRQGKRAMIVYTIASLCPTAIAYIAAYAFTFRQPTIPGFLSWITAHAPDSGFSFQPVSNLMLSLRGTLRLFFGGKLNEFAGDGLSIVVLCVFVISAFALVVLLWLTRQERANLSDAPAHLWVWAGLNLAFLFFWMPQNTFYRLFYLTPLVALAVTRIRNIGSIGKLMWALTAVLWSWNFAFVVYPQSQPERNAPLRFALQQSAKWPAGTPIVFHRFHPDLWTISYFNPQASWITLDTANLQQLESSLGYAHTQGRPLWLEATAYELLATTQTGKRWLALHERPDEKILMRDEKHEFRFHSLH